MTIPMIIHVNIEVLPTGLVTPSGKFVDGYEHDNIFKCKKNVCAYRVDRKDYVKRFISLSPLKL